jgi:hypothetical protein
MRLLRAQQCHTAVRCLLHAAALGHRQPINPAGHP